MAYGSGLFRTGLVVVAIAASAPLMASCQTGPGYGGGYYGDSYSSWYDNDDGYRSYRSYDRDRYRYRDRDRYRHRDRDNDDDHRDRNRRRSNRDGDYEQRVRRQLGLDGQNRDRHDNRDRGGNDRRDGKPSVLFPGLNND